ncbi:MAG: BMC domain-containing protein, partial [Lachnospiraceae bacterium]
VEVTGCTHAIAALDIMAKAAEVTISTWETIFGDGRVTIFVQGDAASVMAAVEAVKTEKRLNIFNTYTIAGPHEETWRMIEKSRKKQIKK